MTIATIKASEKNERPTSLLHGLIIQLARLRELGLPDEEQAPFFFEPDCEHRFPAPRGQTDFVIYVYQADGFVNVRSRKYRMDLEPGESMRIYLNSTDPLDFSAHKVADSSEEEAATCNRDYAW